ncbi:uncharacterized protein M421DRAFT_426209 [Didymella exigua CBS 183.55]|uniref:Secreted protein n=1 Tax=Didymella exigua CBS 183.55 TaxID=1150837 RepID=A0A6A5R4S3_9PLEO|nr:uncharacterized protein M421DRAFT_426209 [Didymella exigua CBS 183.55]KAF1923101.1 hypothetical protein M421DRAFT_426209 [Didymella exigua CBS 183.55]
MPVTPGCAVHCIVLCCCYSVVLALSSMQHAMHPLRSSSISSSTCCHSVLASCCASCQLRVPSPH